MAESDETRRDFLKGVARSTGAAAAFGGMTFLARPERVFGASDRVRVAVCGLRNRGKDHLDVFARVPNGEIAALCDVDETLLNKRRARAQVEAIDHLHNGTFGDIYLARGLCFKRRDTIARTPVEAAPRGVDYDLWTGPAPLKPVTRNRFHYNWHWIWDTGNGDLGNQGIHQVDVAR